MADLIERRFGFKASFVLSLVPDGAHAVSYTVGDDRSVALLGLRALLERGRPLDVNGLQVEQQSFIEMELYRSDGDYAWDTGTRFVPALAELNSAYAARASASKFLASGGTL